MIYIRKAQPSDADNLSRFISTLDSESEFLLYGTGERACHTEIIQAYLSRITQGNKSVVFLAENGERNIIGFLCGEVSPIKRISHVMRINMGIIRAYRGTHASRLLAECIHTYVEQEKIKRIEATVITENQLSLNLCKKFGLKIEGIRKASVNINGRYHDEYMLAKLF